MTQTAFRTDPLSPELNHLINDYPGDAWDAHPNFARSTQNWLGAHQAFRQLSDICVSKTERILDKDMDAEHYGHILALWGQFGAQSAWASYMGRQTVFPRTGQCRSTV